MSARVPAWAVGEFLGTFLLVFIGCGAVAGSTLLGANTGVYPVAVAWGLAVVVAAQLVGGLSGAHLNPAVTCGLAASGRFPGRRVAGYVAAQMAGAFAAAAAVQGFFAGALRSYEAAQGIVRGAAGSEATAMVFAEFFPNPGGRALTDAARATLGEGAACGIEALATAVLMLVVLGVSDARNARRVGAAGPWVVGATVMLLISLVGPLTMACFNPARDLAPRLWCVLGGGWGWEVFRVNGTGWLTVYVLAPIAGALSGAVVYRVVLRGAYAEAEAEAES